MSLLSSKSIAVACSFFERNFVRARTCANVSAAKPKPAWHNTTPPRHSDCRLPKSTSANTKHLISPSPIARSRAPNCMLSSQQQPRDQAFERLQSTYLDLRSLACSLSLGAEGKYTGLGLTVTSGNFRASPTSFTPAHPLPARPRASFDRLLARNDTPGLAGQSPDGVACLCCGRAIVLVGDIPPFVRQYNLTDGVVELRRIYRQPVTFKHNIVVSAAKGPFSPQCSWRCTPGWNGRSDPQRIGLRHGSRTEPLRREGASLLLI